MFNTRLNFEIFRSEDFIELDETDEFYEPLNEYNQSKTIENFLLQYLYERSVSESDAKNLVHSVLGVLRDLNYHLINYNPNNEQHALGSYQIRCSHKMVSLLLNFESFFGGTEIRVDFIAGCLDSVIVSVHRVFLDDVQSASHDFEHTSIFTKGMVEALLSPNYQMCPFKMTSLYDMISTISKPSLKKLNIEDKYEDISNMFKTKISLFKFNAMNDEHKKQFMLSNGTVDVKRISEDEMFEENYDVGRSDIFNTECNPVCEDSLLMPTLDNTMIPISELESVISETMIDTYMLNAVFCQAILLDNMNPDMILNDEVSKKKDELISTYYNFLYGLLSEISKLNINGMNPLFKNIKKHKHKVNLYNKELLRYKMIPDDRLLNIDELNDNNNELISIINEDTTISDTEAKEVYDKYVEITNLYTSIKSKIRKMVPNFDTIYCADKYEKIFNRESFNLINLANTLRICKKTVNVNSIEVRESAVHIKVSQIVDKLRESLNIQCTYSNMERIFKDYSEPLIETMDSIMETINSLNNIGDSVDIPFDSGDII